METSKNDVPALDISDRVIIIARGESNTSKSVLLSEMMMDPELKKTEALEVVLPWLGEGMAKWTKAWVEAGAARGQKRTASIICTEAEKNSVANVFASGVRWVDIDKQAMAPIDTDGR